jgi:hypothetical protein
MKAIYNSLVTTTCRAPELNSGQVNITSYAVLAPPERGCRNSPNFDLLGKAAAKRCLLLHNLTQA